jgi:hypothetical protein
MCAKRVSIIFCAGVAPQKTDNCEIIECYVNNGHYAINENIQMRNINENSH